MSKFTKIVVPLVEKNLTPIDLTKLAGFIDCYTSDIDKPSGECELFLVYDDRIRNEYVSNRMKKLEKSTNLKRVYVKYVNSVPYYVYSLWIKPEVKKLFSGVITLNTIQKARILQFWGPFDNDVDSVMTNGTVVYDTVYEMPAADYNI